MVRSKNRRRNKRGNQAGWLNSTSRQASLGNPEFTFKVPAGTAILSTTVTTGVIAGEAAFGLNSVTGSSARYGALFDEYRVISVSVEVVPMDINAGSTMFFWCEKTLGTPTQLEAVERDGALIPNHEQRPRNLTFRWNTRDFTDASWQLTSANSSPVFFYTYTDTANYGSPAVVTKLWLLRPTLTIQFRGIKST